MEAVAVDAAGAREFRLGFYRFATCFGGKMGSVYDRRMATVAGDVTVFILAGGKSTRMGTDKAFVLLDGQTLLDRMLELVRSVCAEVRIVGDRAKFADFALVVEDVFPGCGPLGGIHAALRSSQTDLNLMLAVDMPFVSAALLDFLTKRARESDAMVTLAHTRDGLQPLCAVYRRVFADSAEKALRAGRYKIDALFGETQTQVIEEAELQHEGFSGELFRNLNTPQDLGREMDDAIH
jgi:molybdopterin-guanine dinucleotide biosynthesis protein A